MSDRDEWDEKARELVVSLRHYRPSAGPDRSGDERKVAAALYNLGKSDASRDSAAKDARVGELENDVLIARDQLTALSGELANKIQSVDQLSEMVDAEHSLGERLMRDVASLESKLAEAERTIAAWRPVVEAAKAWHHEMRDMKWYVDASDLSGWASKIAGGALVAALDALEDAARRIREGT